MSLRRSGRTRPESWAAIARDDAEGDYGEEGEAGGNLNGEGAVLQQSINEAVVAKKQRAPRKSILKHSAPADELEEEEEEGQSAKDGSLFALLLPGGIAVGEITAEWRAKYGTDPTAALAELYTLVARAGGCVTTVTATDLTDSSAEDIGARVTHDMINGNIYDDDPMDCTSAKAAKGRFKAFRANYLMFWDKLLRDSSETDELFSAGGHKPTPATLPLFDSLADLVAMFSGLRVRNIRVAATEAGLQLVTSLVHVAKIKADTRDLKQRQLDAESKKKRPNQAMLRTLKEALVHTQARIHSAESMIKDAFNKIFTHRFRDIDPAIRATCMHSIGCWMRDHPLLFLSDFYLKYLGWSLNDKDPRVRLTVLAALRNLYSASSENLALMDTFNARFISRVREMLNDVDPMVAAAAVGALAVLHAAGVLPRADMEPVVSLLLDGDHQVRVAAAAVIPSLLSRDRADAAAAAVHDRRDGGGSVPSRAEGDSCATVLSIMHIVRALQGTRARIAGTVDALWSVFHDTLSDWNLICTMLLSEAPGANRRQGSTAQAPLESEDAAGLANVLACAVRRAQGESLVRGDASGGHGTSATSLKPHTKAQREAHAHAREAYTQVAMKSLPLLLRRWRSDEAVAAPLIETICHLKLEHYSLKHKEADFEDLLTCVVDIFLQQSSRRVADACAGVLHYAVTEGRESLKDVADRCTVNAFNEVCKRLRVALAAVRAGSGGARAGSGGSDIDEDQGHHFHIRAALMRLNALVSLLPPPLAATGPRRTRDVYEDLNEILVAAAHRAPCVGVRSVVLAARAASLVLVYRMIELDTGEVRDAEVDSHLLVRDDLMATMVILARDAADVYPHSRMLPKAIISAVANLVVYHQHTVGVSAGGKERGESGAAMAARLRLVPAEAALRTVWNSCNAILDIPDPLDASGAHDDVSGDEQVSRMAYTLAMCDVTVTAHNFVAAEFLGNRETAGQWADRAIAALVVDLRNLGPRAIGCTVTNSLTIAFDEVLSGDSDTAAELEEGFSELAQRLAGMFTVGNQRDRVVVRCIVEYGVAFVVPNLDLDLGPASCPDHTRLPFLMLGLAAFIPKLATTDAKTLAEQLHAVVDTLNEEDEQYGHFFEFVNRITARARGGTGHSAAGRGRDHKRPRRRSRSRSATGEREVAPRAAADHAHTPGTDDADNVEDEDDEVDDDGGDDAPPDESAPDAGIRMYGRRRR